MSNSYEQLLVVEAFFGLWGARYIGALYHKTPCLNDASSFFGWWGSLYVDMVGNSSSYLNGVASRLIVTAGLALFESECSVRPRELLLLGGEGVRGIVPSLPGSQPYALRLAIPPSSGQPTKVMHS